MKRLLASFVTALILITGSAVVASPAQAAGPPSCPVNMICWFDSSNWTGASQKVMAGWLQQGVCYNMGYDPSTGINWDGRIDSVWWNEVSQPWTYAEFYDGPNCTVRAVTRVYAWTDLDNQKQSCVEPAVEWLGPCGPPNNVSRRISSWAFRW